MREDILRVNDRDGGMKRTAKIFLTLLFLTMMACSGDSKSLANVELPAFIKPLSFYMTETEIQKVFSAYTINIRKQSMNYTGLSGKNINSDLTFLTIEGFKLFDRYDTQLIVSMGEDNYYSVSIEFPETVLNDCNEAELLKLLKINADECLQKRKDMKNKFITLGKLLEQDIGVAGEYTVGKDHEWEGESFTWKYNGLGISLSFNVDFEVSGLDVQIYQLRN